jgi:hypothetical protein
LPSVNILRDFIIESEQVINQGRSGQGSYLIYIFMGSSVPYFYFAIVGKNGYRTLQPSRKLQKGMRYDPGHNNSVWWHTGESDFENYCSGETDMTGSSHPDHKNLLHTIDSHLRASARHGRAGTFFEFCLPICRTGSPVLGRRHSSCLRESVAAIPVLYLNTLIFRRKFNKKIGYSHILATNFLLY